MKALVIDDSRVMRRIVATILHELGFSTVEAADGQQAIDQLETHPDVELCCIDWNMPVMNGLEFVTEVRGREEWQDITLMMVTTEGEQHQLVRALAAGAHEYVIKPFTPEIIIDKLQLLGLVEVNA